MERADDARARLAALHQPIPRPTKSALALNKAEEAGRGEQTMLSRMMSGFEKHPNISSATKIGEPTLTDPTPISATGMMQQANRVAMGGGKGKDSLSVTTIKGAPGPNEPRPVLIPRWIQLRRLLTPMQRHLTLMQPRPSPIQMN